MEDHELDIELLKTKIQMLKGRLTKMKNNTNKTRKEIRKEKDESPESRARAEQRAVVALRTDVLSGKVLPRGTTSLPEKEIGYGINYGDAVTPTTMTLEGFRVEDYPREYAAAMATYLYGTNIGSRKARERAEALATEDIRQAVLSGSIRPSYRTKIVPVAPLENSATAMPVIPEPPPIVSTKSITKTVVAPNPENTNKGVNTTSSNLEIQDLGLRIDALTQILEHTVTASVNNSDATKQIGVKVAENTMHIDSNRDPLSALNPDGSLKSFRKNYGI
jgi:hypothetical protein